MPGLEVDTSLPAQPTGRARSIAEASSKAKDQDIVLYGAWFCPFVQRTWLTLLEKNIPYQYVEINPYKKDPWYLKLNPKGLVPTLVQKLDGLDDSGERQLRPILDSSTINDWLDSNYNNQGNRLNNKPDEDFEGINEDALLPSKPKQREQSKIWTEHNNKNIIPHFYRVLQHQPHSTYTAESARSDLCAGIAELSRAMSDEGPWFFGAKISMVDISLIPWARRLWLIDHYKDGGSGIPSGGDTASDEGKIWNRWKVWMQAVDQRPSVLDTSSEEKDYLLAYKRYADDTTGSMVGQATRSGGILP